MAGGGKQTLLRAQRDATTPSQGRDCWYQAVSSDRSDPRVGLLTRLSPVGELEDAGSELEPSNGDAEISAAS